MRFKLFITLLSVGFFLTGCAVNPVTGRNEIAVMHISDQEEVTLGATSYQQALQQMGGVYADKGLSSYVNDVGQRLARQSHRPNLRYEFNVVNDSSPNAFALPGGFIAITRGLLINLDNEAQLAAVIGHEIGHVTARHSVQEMQRSAIMGTTVSILGSLAGGTDYGPMLTQAVNLTANLVSKRYSREQEFEADRLGIEYMARGHYALNGAVQLQQMFVNKLDAGQDNNWVGGLFRTHPVSTARLAENRRIISAQYPGYSGNEGLVTGNYARHMLSLQATREAYALYDQARQYESEGQYESAIQTYHKAVQLAPDQSLLLTSLGMAYLRNEDTIPARRYLLKALQIDKSYYQSHLGLGYIYLQGKNYNDAATELESSLALLPTLQGTLLLGDSEAGRRNYTKARQLYETVYQTDSSGQLGQAAAARLRELPQ